jgi:hypothetical protein
VYAKVEFLIDWVSITIRGLVEEVSLSLVLRLVPNQCMVDQDDLLMIVLPSKFKAHICLVD